MQDKDPLTYSALTYGWVLFLSVWGGVVNYYQKYKDGKISKYKIIEFIGDAGTSGFAGVLTFYLCEFARIEPVLSGFLIGLSGHMGARALFIFKRGIENWARTRLKI